MITSTMVPTLGEVWEPELVATLGGKTWEPEPERRHPERPLPDLDPAWVADRFAAAAALVREVGLHRGRMWPRTSPEGGRRYAPGLPVCALGALHVVTGRVDMGAVCDVDGVVDALRAALFGVFAARPGAGGGSVAVWNDHPERTAEEVAQLFDDAAAAWRAKAAVGG